MSDAPMTSTTATITNSTTANATAVDALADQLSGSLRLTTSVSLLDALDEDCIGMVLAMVAGAPSAVPRRHRVFTLTESGCCALMRTVPICREMRPLTATLVTNAAIVSDAKKLKMTAALVPALHASHHPWTPEQAASIAISKMDLVRYLVANADPLWREAGPHCRLLSGSFEAVEKRTMKKRKAGEAQKRKGELAEAYAAWVSHATLDAVAVLRQRGFVHPSCAGLLAPGLFRSLLRHTLEMRSLTTANLTSFVAVADAAFESNGFRLRVAARFRDVAAQLRELQSLDLQLWAESEPQAPAMALLDAIQAPVAQGPIAQGQMALLDELFHFCAELNWPTGCFSFILTLLLAHRLLGEARDYRDYHEWREKTLTATNPRIACPIDPAKGTRWLSVPANAAKVQEVTARNLAKAKSEVPTALSPRE